MLQPKNKSTRISHRSPHVAAGLAGLCSVFYLANAHFASAQLGETAKTVAKTDAQAEAQMATTPCCGGGPNLADLQLAGEAPAGAVWVDSLDLSKMSSGWQKSLAAKSVEGHALTLGSVVYPHGMGTHANSEMGIDVSGATRFVAIIGVDDEVGRAGSVVFELYTDGQRVFRSAVMKGGAAPQPVSIDLAGVKNLTLRVTDADEDINNDHADWAGAMLIYPAGVTGHPVASTSSVPAPPPIDETPITIAPALLASPQPRINGPRVTGATPGRPFLFRIPATGQAPLVYSAKKLPAGLHLDAQTGIISGTLAQPRTTTVQVKVKGPKGVATRALTIIGGAHELSQTPPMGWNSWNIFYCNVDEAKVRSATDWIVKTGLDRHGYQFINIDDCWQGERDAGGNIQVNPKFGDMKALGDFIHAKGLKYGIYSSPGPTTCAGHLGSWGHEAQDVRTYASWGVDYLKHDWCSYGSLATGEGLEYHKKPYRAMRAALDTGDRDIVYSLCQYGNGDVWNWGNDPDIKGNLWRTTGDIGPSYTSMMNIAMKQPQISSHAGPGHWNDPDMLFLHALKPNEQITHLTIWSMLAAPLLIGSDISKLPRFTLDALSNDEVIAIDQDPLGKAATVRASNELTQVWSRPLWDGTQAVALINRGRVASPITANWRDLGVRSRQLVRDVWREKDLGVFDKELTQTVPAHGALMFVIGRPNAKDYQPQNVSK